MTEYEILFLVGESKKSDVGRIQQEVEAVIAAEGGEVQAGEFVDERRMEYQIRRERRGVYIAKRFTVKDDSGDIAGALSKKLALFQDVLRFLIVKAEGLPTLEESQERVKRVSDRFRSSGRGSRDRRAPRQAASAPTSSDPISEKSALSDTEIDKKLGEVLNI